jgi:hypothetical protein
MSGADSRTHVIIAVSEQPLNTLASEAVGGSLKQADQSAFKDAPNDNTVRASPPRRSYFIDGEHVFDYYWVFRAIETGQM